MGGGGSSWSCLMTMITEKTDVFLFCFFFQQSDLPRVAQGDEYKVCTGLSWHSVSQKLWWDYSTEIPRAPENAKKKNICLENSLCGKAVWLQLCWRVLHLRIKRWQNESLVSESKMASSPSSLWTTSIRSTFEAIYLPFSQAWVLTSISCKSRLMLAFSTKIVFSFVLLPSRETMFLDNLRSVGLKRWRSGSWHANIRTNRWVSSVSIGNFLVD